jgi:hypothetical protein
MPTAKDETRQTLKALEQLICVAEWMGLASPDQRAALQALRGRRAALKKLLAVRKKLNEEKIVCLTAWRGGKSEFARA